MKTRITFFGHVLSLVFGVVLVCLLSACNWFGLGATTQKSSPQGPANTQAQTPVQVLQSAADAMQHLKSVHIVMNVGTTSGTTATNQQQNMLSVKANGDQVFPDQASLHLSLGQMIGGNQRTLSEIVTNKKLYVQNPQGQWHVIDIGKLTGAPFVAPQVSNYNNLLVLAQKANVTDHGEEMLNGQMTRHITVTFGNDALKDLLNATGQLGSLSSQQQQDLNQALSQIKLNSSMLELWIDKANSYVSRLELKCSISTNAAASTNAASNANSSVDAIIDYSNFNEQVTITAPAQAIPVDSAENLLQ